MTLWQKILWFFFKERILNTMGFQPPAGIPVPLVSVPELGWTFGFWYAYNGSALICVAGIFGKGPGMVDYSNCAQVWINQQPQQNKEIVDQEWNNDEAAVILEHLKELNPKFDAWLRAQFPGWEPTAQTELLSEAQIDALPDGYQQLNWTIASKFGITVNVAKKTIDVVKTA